MRHPVRREVLVGLVAAGEGVVPGLPGVGVRGDREGAVHEPVRFVLPDVRLDGCQPGHDGEPDEDDPDDEEEELLLAHRRCCLLLVERIDRRRFLS